MGTTAYPGGIDDFSTTSPTNLGDDDSKGRVHSERHDDMEAAMEAVQAELGVDPAGASATVVARLDAHDANTDAHIPAGAATLGAVGALQWDESVGRRCFAWDTVNSRWQMVYGDTGWRDVDGLLENGWTATSLAIRREGQTVTMQAYALAYGSAGTFYTLPAGFRPGPAYANIRFIAENGSGTTGVLAIDNNNGSPNGQCVGTPSGTFYFAISWQTNDAWPSSLPGTASDSIPSS